MIVIEWSGCGETSDYDVTKSLPEASNLEAPQLILVRGIPGSGKSTLAKKLAKVYRTDAHFEADDWMLAWNEHQKKYVYHFDGREIGNAHDWCQHKVSQHMAWPQENPYIVVSNTNKQMWEMQPYFDMANAYGYGTTVINCRRHGHSIHNISDDKIAALRLYWEELPNA
jgi:predicted ATPase